MLLDALTIFLLVAGSLLLWVNIRRDPSQVILTNPDDEDDGRTLESIAHSIRAGLGETSRLNFEKSGHPRRRGMARAPRRISR